MKLWDKGFSIDKKIENFTVGNDREIDLHIAKYDVQASLAHAIMLTSIGILNSEELKQLKSELENMFEQIDKGEFVIGDQFEDVHSKIEFELTQQLGDVGKKIHTARSRNDQVLVALQLYYKENLAIVNSKVKSLFDVLLALAETHKEKLLPGYTHLQVAMPSSFGLWFSAYAESLTDDLELLQSTFRITNQNPLGSAAGYGSSFPLDRQLTTDLLGFSNMNYNVVYAQMGRGKVEKIVSFALANLGATLSKLAYDVCLFMSQNFNFV